MNDGRKGRGVLKKEKDKWELKAESGVNHQRRKSLGDGSARTC